MKRILEFESLRGILALWVIVTHALPAMGIKTNSLGLLKIFGQGYYAVDVFIIMSGFFIFYLLDSAREDYKVFITRRFLRLYPVYLVCLVLSILLMPLSLAALQNSPWGYTHNAGRMKIFEDSQTYFLPDLLAHLTLLHGVIPNAILPNSSFAFIGQAWSISLEWQFYLLAPLFFRLLNRYKVKVVPLLLIVVTILHLLLKGDSALLFTKIPLFLLGILSFYFWKQRHQLFQSNQIYKLFLPIALILLLFFSRQIPVMVWCLVFFSTLSVEMTGGLLYEKLLCKILAHPILLSLGKISYSIYLSHMIFLYLMIYLLNLLKISDQGMYGVSLLISTLVLTIAFSQMLYISIEKPFIKVGKQLYNN